MKFLRLIVIECKGWVTWLVMGLPSTPLGNKVRCLYWARQLGSTGLNIVGRNAEVISRDPLQIGKNFVMGPNVVIDNCDSLGCYIGDGVGIAQGTYIRTANHKFDDVNIPWMNQGHSAKSLHYHNRSYSIVIEDDVWVGAHCVILSGAYISTGSVISAGSVVSGFIPPYSIVVGNPARVVLNRKKVSGATAIEKDGGPLEQV